jgi:hypothetical protein
MNRESRNDDRQQSPSLTFYNKEDRQTIGNAMGSRRPSDTGRANSAHPVTADRFSRLLRVLESD